MIDSSDVSTACADAYMSVPFSRHFHKTLRIHQSGSSVLTFLLVAQMSIYNIYIMYRSKVFGVGSVLTWKKKWYLVTQMSISR